MRFLGFLPFKYRLFLTPAVVLFGVFIAIMTAGRFMVEQLLELRSRISDVKTENRLLEAKVNTLALFDQNQLNAQVQIASRAVPTETSALFVLSTMRNIAGNTGVTVSNFNVAERKKGEKEVNSVEVLVDGRGSVSSIISFINGVQKTVPLSRVVEVRINGTRNSASANLKIVSIWNPLSSTLGKIDAPIEDLKTSERDILDKLTSLELPQGGEFSVSPPIGRQNPFGF